MLKFIFKSNFRLITRNKFISLVKIAGMACGTAVVLLTGRFCIAELAYDQQHPNYDRIFRYVHSVSTPEGIESFAFTSATTGPALKERYPEVESYTRVFRPANVSVSNIASDVSFNERSFVFADSNFFDLFHFPVAGRQKSDLLNTPYSVVLTPATAAKYFGTEDPLGQSILLNGELEFVVKGVLIDDIANSHFKFDFIASFSSLVAIANDPVVSRQIPASKNLEQKGFNAFYTYLLLADPQNAQSLEAKFPSFIEEFRGEGRSQRLKPYLQSLESIHLHSNLHYEIGVNGTIKEVYVYLYIGLITLLISCINYINISTAEFLKRAQGIGLKKILGVDRGLLMWAHFLETMMLSLFSILVGFITALALLPAFNNIVKRNLDLFSMEVVYLLGGIFVTILLVSGIYPAFRISQAGTMEAFKGTLLAKPSKLNLRNLLAGFQLTVSFCLITLSLLIFFQIDYLLTRDLGFDSDQIVVLNATSVEPDKRIAFKNSLVNNRNIPRIGMCSMPPGENLFTYGLTFSENEADEERRVTFFQSFVDSDFLEALGLNMTTGRFFHELNAADSDRYIVINHAAMVTLGDSALNKRFKYRDAFKNKEVDKSVIGVINDFNFASLHENVMPLMLEYDPLSSGYFLVRFDKMNAQGVLEDLRTAWRTNFPIIPFDYYFLDDRFQALYEGDQRQKSLITSIAIIAVGLAALGIFGSALFAAEQKSRQVGIRKVLGSNQLQLIMLLLKPTFLLVLVASLLGSPFALYFGASWLSQYPSRIDYSPAFFAIAFVLVALIVVTTILYHCFKLASINPIEVLRKNDM